MICSRQDVENLLKELDYVPLVSEVSFGKKNYFDNLIEVRYSSLDFTRSKNDYSSFVTLDVETTGLSPKYGDKICQITAVKFENFKPVKIFTSLINPLRHIPISASNVHGIYDSDVEFSLRLEDIISQLEQFLDNNLIIGHNIKFDLGFLMNEGIALHKLNIEVLDTLSISRLLLKRSEVGNYKLGSLCKYYGIDYFNYHDSTEDVLATSYIFLRLLDEVYLERELKVK